MIWLDWYLTSDPSTCASKWVKVGPTYTESELFFFPENETGVTWRLKFLTGLHEVQMWTLTLWKHDLYIAIYRMKESVMKTKSLATEEERWSTFNWTGSCSCLRVWCGGPLEQRQQLQMDPWPLMFWMLSTVLVCQWHCISTMQTPPVDHRHQTLHVILRRELMKKHLQVWFSDWC